MPERRTSCWQCRSYDRDARRCRIGKTNPRKKHESLTVAEMMGVQALCLHNPYREPLILRMRHPHSRFIWTEPTPRPFEEPLDIEIIDDDLEPERLNT